MNMVSSLKPRKYDENSIVVLKGPEKIRKNLGMYVGGIEQGHNVIFKEILDNAIDETRISKAKDIYIDIAIDDTITVSDCGRGIPVKNHKDFKNVSTLTVIFTELHAGGKFDADDGATVGTHGVGATATNALSEYFQVMTKVGNVWHGQEFHRGVPKGRVAPYKYASSRKDVKTIVKFRPDPQIFGKLRYTAPRLLDMIRTQSFFNKGVAFHVTYPLTKDGKKTNSVKYLSKRGIADFVDDIVRERGLTQNGPTFLYSSAELDVALSWTSLDDELMLSYVSSSKTASGGTHVSELEKVIAEALRAVGGKKVEKIKPALLRSGLLGIVNARVPRPMFSSQTKERLINPEAKAMVRKAYDALVKYFKSNKELVRAIIERAIVVGEAEATFKLSKKAAAKLNGPRGKTILPELHNRFHVLA